MLDEALGNFDKVALNFSPHTPMVFNRKKDIGNQICFLIIKARVATWQDVVFTNTNAAKPGHRRLNGMAGVRLVDFAAVKAPPFGVSNWHESVQAEVLVPYCIALDQVERVVFVSEASCREAERLWGSSPHPPFEVAREYFASHFRDTKPISFAYVDKFYLTDGNSCEHPGFSLSLRRTPVRNIHTEAHLQVLTGTTLRMELQPAGKEITKQYERRDRVHFRPYFSTGSLAAGEYSIECYLNEIRWARLDFELTD